MFNSPVTFKIFALQRYQRFATLCPDDTSYLVTSLDDDVQVTLDSFAPTTNETIIDIIKYLPDKSCKVDTMPTWLFIPCVRELALIIAAIVMRYFETSHVPVELKRAHNRLRLKKPSNLPDHTKQLPTSFELTIRLQNNRKSC